MAVTKTKCEPRQLWGSSANSHAATSEEPRRTRFESGLFRLCASSMERMSHGPGWQWNRRRFWAKQFGCRPADGSGFPWATLILFLLGLGLSACAASQSIERSSDGSTVNLDQLSVASKEKARQNIVLQLKQDVPVFHLNIGDEFSVFFDVNPEPTRDAYLIAVSDKLYVGFLNDPENSRTITVRPDGRISLPRIGPVMAAGQTADALAREIDQHYSGIQSESDDVSPDGAAGRNSDVNQDGIATQDGIASQQSIISQRPITGQRQIVGQPEITVNVIQSHSPDDRFATMIGPSTKSGGLVTKVLPDGTIALPLVPPLEAQGRTLEQVRYEADAAYSGAGLAVTVSLVPRVLYAGSTMVFGEVAKPGRIALNRPHTVLMTVAQAGGVLPTGSMDSVRVFYVGSDGNPRLRVVNLKEVMNDLKLEDDMIVPDNSIIYVPPTELVKAARVSKTIAELMQFNGYGFNFDYIINQPSNNNSTTSVISH